MQQHIKQAECEAEAQIIDNPSEEINTNQEDDGSSNSFMMDEDDDDNSSSSKQHQSKKKTVEIRADHIAKIAAELLLDLS